MSAADDEKVLAEADAAVGGASLGLWRNPRRKTVKRRTADRFLAERARARRLPHLARSV